MTDSSTTLAPMTTAEVRTELRAIKRRLGFLEEQLPRVPELIERIGTHDEQIETIVETQDDQGATIVQLQAGVQRLKTIAIRQMGALSNIDRNLKILVGRVAPVAPPVEASDEQA